MDILGLAFATNTVTVGGQTAYRKGEYFRDQYPVNNSSSAAWTNMAVGETSLTTNTGNLYVPKTPEAFAYDADGNLTNDGRWTYTWDAENRLIAMTTNGVAAGPTLALGFGYDWQSRRIQKQVSYNGTVTNNTTFAYDGWNPIGRLNATNSNVAQAYMWGLDLSGSIQGAGGVGGLLEISDTVNGIHFAAYDGNGNVAGLVQATAGTNSATYEYGPFGELLRATGPMAKANPFRFSTKFQDDETDFLYYGYRYYNPSTGRWLSRDPLWELGYRTLANSNDKRPEAGNLYLMVLNDPLREIDPLGLTPGPASTGCRICREAGLLNSIVGHRWIECPTSSAGFYPGADGIWCGVGVIMVPDPHAADPESSKHCLDIKCDCTPWRNCKTCDPTKFQRCIANQKNNTPPRYCFPSYTCGDWAVDATYRCLKLSCQ